jgi:hypothetical protein
MSKQSSFSFEELLQCGHGEMFGPGNAQLPVPNMLMMVAPMGKVKSLLNWIFIRIYGFLNAIFREILLCRVAWA